MTERDETGVELLLSEPEIVAWLEPNEHKDDDDEPSRGSSWGRWRTRSSRA